MAAEAKWEGTPTAHLRSSTAEAVWPLLQDFYGVHKWLPTIDTCHKVDQQEANGSISNHVRYCGAGEGEDLKWCHERLLVSDPVAMSLTYQILDNNMGVKDYRSTMRAVPIPIDDGSSGSGYGCRIEWSFLADPVEGLTQEGLLAYLDGALQGMANNMEKALTLSHSHC